MNKAILSFFALLITSWAANAQVQDGLYNISTTYISFTSDSIPNYIPDTAAIPLWQIGHSHKAFFGSDSSETTIMTDTIHPYRINANNWFVIKVPFVFNAIIDFAHKFQTDSGHAGGIVEFSLDTGVTWQNVKGDCNVDGSFGTSGGILTTNFYNTNDTLISGVPAFNGNSDSIQYSRFQFYFGPAVSPHKRITSGTGCSFPIDTFYIRFRFVSDSLIDSLAGWEIDSIKVEEDYYSGLVKNINKLQPLSIYPNPSYDGIFTFPVLENEQDYTTEVYNAMGKRVLCMPYKQSLDLAHYAKGLYFYKVGDGTNYYSGQLEIE